ncbi:hypothetical protein Y1Q_0004343 [Alligator mississippiensis]|uniref:Uncharacterized protein n=1 Tax=Alligator mississippiensis TaxID=8496 RepID=A0A151MIG1_ALLMI|nr:hypothetical protein Y1Q_0004343 [Alligator mississippiensis]
MEPTEEVVCLTSVELNLKNAGREPAGGERTDRFSCVTAAASREPPRCWSKELLNPVDYQPGLEHIPRGL